MSEKKLKKEEKQVELTPEELAIIEGQRKEQELLLEFRESYEKLVEKTGFAWMVDGNSTLNNIQLGIGKVNR